ncbi:hypothetical protein Gasu_04880 isoform 1 [Galdieria sulphuraria]|uniref:Uncharacterized protein n=1 Tax=Galdieria sulphuraria TaxID=130081 RepID=M2W966_GALSU|nr:hypothetical protein Gasu_04880 isoform 1 [Galdieria sulphuraria]EME32401.1 hypothetical protein isoform 1 [Galdieria sulphuraria]|eukprot:XP_005708921.1 hypothetical protein isoform 1 [Galdieria sulphuraria]
MQELRLKAVVWNENVEYLRSFLRAHCTSDEDFGSFCCLEQCYSIPNTPQQMGSVCVSRELLEGEDNSWWVIYRGKKDLQSPPYLEKRPYCRSEFKNDPREWLESLGCKLQFEYIRKGHSVFLRSVNFLAELFQVFSVNSENVANTDLSQELVSEEAILVIYTLIEGGKDWSQSSQSLINILDQISHFVSTK